MKQALLFLAFAFVLLYGCKWPIDETGNFDGGITIYNNSNKKIEVGIL